MSLRFPKITWSGDAHTITFGTPVDNPRAFPHVEQERARVPSTGEQDSWTRGVFQRLRFEARWVPASGSASDTGWNHPSPGWRAFKEHQLQDKDDATFFPDKDAAGSHSVQLIEFNERKENSGQHYRITMEIEDTDGEPFDDY